MDLELIYRHYRTERERVLAVYTAVNPAVCPRCGTSRPPRLEKNKNGKANFRSRIIRCRDCAYSRSALKGTLFYHSESSLGDWFELIKLLDKRPNLGGTAAAGILGVHRDWVRSVKPRIMDWLYTQEHEDKNRSGRQEVQPLDKD